MKRWTNADWDELQKLNGNAPYHGCFMCVHGTFMTPDGKTIKAYGTHVQCQKHGVVEKRKECPDFQVDTPGYNFRDKGSKAIKKALKIR